MYDDLKTLIWFLRKGPKFYATMIALIFRKFRPLKDSPEHVEIEKNWKYIVDKRRENSINIISSFILSSFQRFYIFWSIQM